MNIPFEISDTMKTRIFILIIALSPKNIYNLGDIYESI